MKLIGKLIGARVATGPETSARRDLVIHGAGAEVLDLRGYLILPGLINAHDHLEFNLFPRLANRLYPNAGEWARDIFHPEASPIREQLAVPKAIRLMWGGLRNLLSGVSTVAHHNPWEPDVFTSDFPVRVLRDFSWAHSLDFTPNISDLYRAAPLGHPFILHAAEGTDEKARREIQLLDELGVLGPRTVLVHAIASGGSEIDLLRKRRCSIVWCPGSNFSLFGKTLSHEALRSGIPIALGTDSALTFAGDLLDEIRTAHSRGLSPAEIYPMVTSAAATILRLADTPGDLVAIPDCGQSPAEALLDLKPALVMVGGVVKLIAPHLNSGLSPGLPLNPIHVEGRDPVLVAADVALLHRQTCAALGPDYQLAGRRVAA